MEMNYNTTIAKTEHDTAVSNLALIHWNASTPVWISIQYKCL